MKREAGYSCTYKSEHGEGRSWVRAWDDEQANVAARKSLRGSGRSDAVVVRVERVDGSRAPAPRPARTQR